MGDIFSMGGAAGKILDPGDAFGIQAGQDAAKKADALGQQTLGMQQDWLQYIKDINSPYTEAGASTLGMQMDMLGGLSTGPDYAAAAQSPMYQQMMQKGAEGITQQAAATGGLRGGNIQNALAENSQNALLNTAQRDYANQMDYFNTLGSISGAGMNATQNVASYGGDTMGGISSTMGGLASGGLNAAATQTNQQTGIIGMIGSMFSDKRLKDNIKFTGDYTEKGFRLYTWDWNENAKPLHLTGQSRGVIADEVEVTMPELITLDKSGYKVVNYAGL